MLTIERTLRIDQAAGAAAPMCTAGRANYATTAGAGASWASIARKSLTVPAFHDRRPLPSTT